ncbi:MAG: hypothetical protein C0601_05300, partial [Candidatus Muiribacterium halophilum]
MSDYLHLIHELGDESWLTRKKASQELKEKAPDNPEIIEELEKVLESDNDDVVFWAIQTLGGIPGELCLSTLKRISEKNKTIKSHVALALQDNPDPETIDLLLEYMGDDSWSVCNNATSSIIKRGEDALETIIDSLKKANYNKAYWLTKALSRMGDKGVSVLEHFLKFNNKDVNILVTEALCESNSQSAIQVLLKCLTDESHNVRQNAVDALIKFGPDVIEPMLLYLDSSKFNIKISVENIIEHLDSRKITVLRNLLTSENRNLRMLAAEFLGRTGSPVGIEPLVGMLKDKLWLVRKSAAKGLVLIGEKAIPALVASLETDDENTKYWISNVLGRLGEPALNELVRMLNEGSKDLRMYAVMALGEYRNESAIIPLINALSDKAWPVRNSAANALKNFGSLALLPVLKSLLSNNDDVRFWSRKVFEEIAPRDIDLLIRLLTNSNDGEMRYLVAYGLGIIGDKKAVPALVNSLLNDNNDWVRKYAASALGKLEDERSIEPLISILSEDNEELEYWTAKVLGQMGEIAIEKLQACLDSPQEKVRFFSILALGAIGDKKSIDILIKILGEEGESAQKAIKALAETKEAIPALVEALGSSNLNVRSNASKALIRIGNAAVDPLMEVVNSENKEVHYWAAKSLREIQTESEKA